MNVFVMLSRWVSESELLLEKRHEGNCQLGRQTIVLKGGVWLKVRQKCSVFGTGATSGCGLDNMSMTATTDFSYCDSFGVGIYKYKMKLFLYVSDF